LEVPTQGEGRGPTLATSVDGLAEPSRLSTPCGRFCGDRPADLGERLDYEGEHALAPSQAS
jgi:hypothetical protein